MAWVARRRVFHTDGQRPWMVHHASCPTPFPLDDERLRIYFSPRDELGRTRPALVEVDAADPARILHLCDEPLLALGRPGAFDDCGVMPSCVVEHDGEHWLYYTGWTTGGTVPYRNAAGLAISTDGGRTFTRAFESPLLDRTPDDPFMTLSPCVRHDGERWRMWFGSVSHWEQAPDGRQEPVYHLRHATSPDGLTWARDPEPCLAPLGPDEAIGRPWVVRDADRYRMWFSRRGTLRFRTDPARTYRVGYAESADGVTWERVDPGLGMAPADGDGWDADMVEYAAVYDQGGRRQVLYCGNGFGRSGFGHAVLDAEASS